MSRSRPLRLTKHKLLKPGIHQMTLEQIERLFGQFQGSDHRPGLFAKLREYLDELQKTGWTVQVLLDGSFVMPQVDRPDDVDLILVFPANWDFQAEVPPFAYSLLSIRRAKMNLSWRAALSGKRGWSGSFRA